MTASERAKQGGEFTAFLFAGIVNTAIGYGVFLLAWQAGLTPAAANAVGYAVALGVAYFLNRRFVFRHRTPRKGAPVIFLLCFGLAFCVNQGVLQALLTISEGPVALFQLIAMGCYTITFFALNRYFVFGGRQ